MEKYVYLFNEGNKDMRELLGGKGANLAEMTNLGLPVPSGFTITTNVCQKYYENNATLPKIIEEEILNKIESLESITNKKFGDTSNPLLVSVRSGSRASMPGMMDTILNLGMNDEIAASFSCISNNKRFVYDSYRRLIMMFADVVKGYSKEKFERHLDQYKKNHNLKSDIDLTSEDMMQITSDFKQIYLEVVGEEFPSNPKIQLLEAVKAVFKSWNNERAIYYRKMNDIPDSWGTAVNVQEMVYGNKGENCGTGVAFTRNPATGENKLYGEYLINAQGEDVVAGVRTPESIDKLASEMPEIYNQFKIIAKNLEKHYKDMQDMEFTIENSKLYILQTRNGKRTSSAAVKIAVDLVKEGLITQDEALLMVNPNQLDGLLHSTFKEESLKNGRIIARGLAASPGAASGKIFFNAQNVIEATKNGENTILVRLETSPEDIEGMNYAKGILTVRGGMTSHAAVVARGMGRCCICGCSELTIDEKNKTLTTKDGLVLKEQDEISLNGSTGEIYLGKLESKESTISGDFETFMNWADKKRRLNIRANAETKKDASIAKKLGAEGIGICRTEHMFFEQNRIFSFRKMIVANKKEDREAALSEILPYQRKDFEELFKEMTPYPVVIRYLDPPLHEFLPKEEKEIEELANSLNIAINDLKIRISELKELNPMMGHRGCRLAITYPEIAKMQTKAIIEAAINVKKSGVEVKPEIMIPLIGDIEELKYVKNIVLDTAKKIMNEKNMKIPFMVGTMIELPRAAVLADEIAEDAEFFSFGTNDLTQMSYGFSRDDAGKFLKTYYEKGIFEIDPFIKIDEKGVGELVKIAVEKGRKTRENIELGICGEHGGDPTSIEFCHKIGLDYVSCSPYRVPIARLAAAQAVIKSEMIN